jgi:hypothetical protein
VLHNLHADDYEYDKLPLFMTFTYEDDVHDAWMVHFTDKPETVDAIMTDGFKGVPNMEDLACTGVNDEGLHRNGYCFAFELGDAFYNFEKGHGMYGENGVIFRGNGVKLWHNGDSQLQTIFIGNETKDLVGFYRRDGVYVSADGKIKNSNFDEFAEDVVSSKGKSAE